MLLKPKYAQLQVSLGALLARHITQICSENFKSANLSTLVVLVLPHITLTNRTSSSLPGWDKTVHRP